MGMKVWVTFWKGDHIMQNIWSTKELAEKELSRVVTMYRNKEMKTDLYTEEREIDPCS